MFCLPKTGMRKCSLVGAGVRFQLMWCSIWFCCFRIIQIRENILLKQIDEVITWCPKWLLQNDLRIFKRYIFEQHKYIPIVGVGGGVLRKILTGVCGQGFRNHTLGYGDWRPKSYPWLRKMGQNQTLDNRKCYQINHFRSNFAWNWSNLVQFLSFASKTMVKLGQNDQNLLSLSQN